MWEKFSNFFETLNDKTVGWSSQCSSNLAYYIEEWHIFTFCRRVWLCLILWFTMGPIFWYLKLKTPHFFLRLEARHLQEIHWYGNFCWMYGLALIVSIPTLNTCQILMRFMRLLMVTEAWNPALRAKSWIQLLWPEKPKLANIKILFLTYYNLLSFRIYMTFDLSFIH